MSSAFGSLRYMRSYCCTMVLVNLFTHSVSCSPQYICTRLDDQRDLHKQTFTLQVLSFEV
jgi:hypothetical protein